MNKYGTMVRAIRPYVFCDNIDLQIWQRTRDGIMVAQPLVFSEVASPLVTTTLPLVSICPEEAQYLMDSLWECGLRPSEGTGSAGSLRATQDHLADMRKIVMNKLGIEKG